LAFYDFNRVTRLMILNLKSQKLMYGFDRLNVGGRNANLCATVDLFVLVFDISLRPLHRLNARRSLPVNEHRRREIAFGKHLGNVLEMSADLISASCVVIAVGRDLNGSTVIIEAKMMRGLGVRKTHCLVSTLVHLRVSFFFRPESGRVVGAIGTERWQSGSSS
jgi:hypothetical protein